VGCLPAWQQTNRTGGASAACCVLGRPQRTRGASATPRPNYPWVLQLHNLK